MGPFLPFPPSSEFSFLIKVGTYICILYIRVKGMRLGVHKRNIFLFPFLSSLLLVASQVPWGFVRPQGSSTLPWFCFLFGILPGRLHLSQMTLAHQGLWATSPCMLHPPCPDPRSLWPSFITSKKLQKTYSDLPSGPCIWVAPSVITRLKSQALVRSEASWYSLEPPKTHLWG